MSIVRLAKIIASKRNVMVTTEGFLLLFEIPLNNEHCSSATFYKPFLLLSLNMLVVTDVSMSLHTSVLAY